MNIHTVNLTMYAASLAVIASLLFTVYQIRLRSYRLKQYISILLVFFAGSVLCFMSSLISGRSGPGSGFLMFAVINGIYLCAAFGYPMLVSYLYQITPDDFHKRGLKGFMLRMIWLTAAVQLFMLCLNLFTGIQFSVSPDAGFIHGKLFGSFEILTLVQMILMIILVERNTKNRFSIQPLRLICILPAAGAVTTLLYPKIYLVLPMSALSLLLIYVNVYLQNEENLRLREIELSDQRLSILLGQIRPHFIFNVLNTIYYLCDTDPSAARKATSDFHQFLENNNARRYAEGPVPFAVELENVICYTDLEKLRFDQIEFIYDIQYSDFELPPLTVQPLVENAVRHGCREMSGGRIEIKTMREKDCCIVEVRDNGAGFKENYSQDGKRHVGIENVRNRLSMISGASLSIDSVQPHGTSAKIRIPLK